MIVATAFATFAMLALGVWLLRRAMPRPKSVGEQVSRIADGVDLDAGMRRMAEDHRATAATIAKLRRAEAQPVPADPARMDRFIDRLKNLEQKRDLEHQMRLAQYARATTMGARNTTPEERKAMTEAAWRRRDEYLSQRRAAFNDELIDMWSDPVRAAAAERVARSLINALPDVEPRPIAQDIPRVSLATRDVEPRSGSFGADPAPFTTGGSFGSDDRTSFVTGGSFGDSGSSSSSDSSSSSSSSSSESSTSASYD